MSGKNEIPILSGREPVLGGGNVVASGREPGIGGVDREVTLEQWQELFGGARAVIDNQRATSITESMNGRGSSSTRDPELLAPLEKFLGARGVDSRELKALGLVVGVAGLGWGSEKLMFWFDHGREFGDEEGYLINLTLTERGVDYGGELSAYVAWRAVKLGLEALRAQPSRIERQELLDNCREAIESHAQVKRDGLGNKVYFADFTEEQKWYMGVVLKTRGVLAPGARLINDRGLIYYEREQGGVVLEFVYEDKQLPIEANPVTVMIDYSGTSVDWPARIYVSLPKDEFDGRTEVFDKIRDRLLMMQRGPKYWQVLRETMRILRGER